MVRCGGATGGSRDHPRFLIARRGTEKGPKDTVVLVLRVPDGRTALPVFGLEEEAGMFLWLETAGEGWRVVEFSEEALAAMLREACAGVRWIVHPFEAKAVGKGPEIVAREDFLRTLPGEQSHLDGKAEYELLPSCPPAGKEVLW